MHAFFFESHLHFPTVSSLYHTNLLKSNCDCQSEQTRRATHVHITHRISEKLLIKPFVMIKCNGAIVAKVNAVIDIYVNEITKKKNILCSKLQSLLIT